MAERPEDLAPRPLPADADRLLHDLRGPLNSATMHAEILRRVGHPDPDAVRSLRTLLQQLGRLAEMLPAAFDVLALEREEVRRVGLRPIVESALAEPPLRAVTVEPGPWPEVVADADLLRLAVAHLARNAVEASASGARPPRVSVSAPEPGRVAVAVRSWGAPLPSTNPKVLIRLLHSSKPGHRGLGLVTAERIARVHGGTLQFEEPGDGAVVTLILPAAPPA